jgi:serine/threonine-protein kinase
VIRVGMLLAAAGFVFLAALWSTLQDHFEASRVAVPDVRNLDEATAREQLDAQGLGLEIEQREAHESIEAGLITHQNPVPGAQTRKRRDVKVVVSLGAVRLAAPALIGRTRREALIELRRQKLVAGDIVQVHSARAADDVIGQEPPPGGALDPTGRVGLVVSLGPPAHAFVMPNLRGRRLTEAERLFGAVGMRIAEVREQFIPGQPDGIVQSQSPERGSRVVRETAVRLIISRSSPLPTSVAPPVPVPTSVAPPVPVPTSVAPPAGTRME